MQQNEFARRFTDVEYLSKKEIINRLGGQLAETAWRLTTDYREKYRFALDLKKFDRVPFSIVLTPSLMSLANSAERRMLEYALLFEKHNTLQKISDEKSLDSFKHSVIMEDLLLVARHSDMQIGPSDLVMMLDSASLHLKDSHIYGIYKCINMLNSNPTAVINKSLIRDIWNTLNNISYDEGFFYRNADIPLAETNLLGEKEINGAASNRIPEFMNMLFEFVSSNYELSPFIIASVIFTYVMYVVPFDHYSNHLAMLLLEKTLADSGYGESAYYLSISQFLLQKEGEWNQILEEVKRTGDLTYSMCFICNLMIDAIDWKLKTLIKVQLPPAYSGEVKVVEKIVEVPREIVKEVIKEVPVEKIVYRDVYVPTPAVHEEIEKPVNKTPEETVEKEKITKPGFSFIDDPFGNQEEIVDKAPKSAPSATPDTSIEKPAFVSTEQIDLNDLVKFEGLEPEDFARHLVELNPLIRFHQALFYANNHTKGRFYTIGNFKQAADCAYETARTSMDFLTSLGLYRKEQLKNKFVYTPVTLEPKEEK